MMDLIFNRRGFFLRGGFDRFFQRRFMIFDTLEFELEFEFEDRTQQPFFELTYYLVF